MAYNHGYSPVTSTGMSFAKPQRRGSLGLQSSNAPARWSGERPPGSPWTSVISNQTWRQIPENHPENHQLFVWKVTSQVFRSCCQQLHNITYSQPLFFCAALSSTTNTERTAKDSQHRPATLDPSCSASRAANHPSPRGRLRCLFMPNAAVHPT